ncbi:MAG: DNA replication and repair protein RecF [Paramuribaculum sp.]|nr:DNA replication and repair protein RecF [Paramuribaculum sp.]
MLLRNLTLTNFKNIAEARLDFSPKINCFLGNNGMGKSNLLDAVYFLSFCKSFTGVPDSMLIRDGEDFAMAKGRYERSGVDEELTLGLARGRRKSLKRAGKEYSRLSEHIGLFPLVMTAPADIDLVRGTSEERRRWMDMVISQGDRRYLDALIRYNAALEQRNKLLRDGATDKGLFEAVELQMDMAASYIHPARERWIAELQILFDKFYRDIAGDGCETVVLGFEGSLAGGKTLTDGLDAARARDEAIRHTTVGPHRDDISMTLNGMPMKRTASQGQCKTFTTALRFAQYDFLHKVSGMRPLLLLDDIFDKLDAERVERIMTMVTGDDFGQIFITDTNRAHLDEIVSRTAGTYGMWNVDNGVFSK